MPETAAFLMLVLSSFGFFAGFRACVLWRARMGDVPALFLVPLVVNGALVMLTTALLVAGAAR